MGDGVNKQFEETNTWFDAREAELAEVAFVALEQGDVVTMAVAEQQLSFHRLVREAVNSTELR